MKPFCFVLMPFGKKPGIDGRIIEFDTIYNQIIKPAIESADLEPIRADEEIVGGIIHKPMFDRLMLCDYAVADLTTANPNVLYELGVRHGLRPHSSILIFANGMRLPFDVAPLRGLPYEINKKGLPANPGKARKNLSERLIESRNPVDDSPVYQLVSEMPRVDLARLKTDNFCNLVEYSKKIKNQLKDARQSGSEAVSKIEQKLTVVDADPAIVIDLFLSYRAVEDWEAMVNLADKMSPELSKSVMVQEQLGFALNRIGRHKEAEQVLLNIIEAHGPSSETYGILGRVYKDLWEKSVDEGKSARAAGYLNKAIETYLKGFETDWRDAYPGINAVTLMEVREQADHRQSDLIPVVKFAVERRINSKTPDYWDYATRLELDVLENNKENAFNTLSKALTEIREVWEPKTTIRNLRLIRRAREKRGEEVDWLIEIEEELEGSEDQLSTSRT